MERTDILNKILLQSQMTAVIANVSDSDTNLKELLNEYFCFVEEIWEKAYQENKRNHSLEIMILKQNKRIKDLTAEIEFYKD